MEEQAMLDGDAEDCTIEISDRQLIQDRWKWAIKKIIKRNKYRAKWRGAVRTLITMRKLFVYYEIVKLKDERPRWQFYAVVQLAIFFKEDGDIPAKLLHVKRILQEASLQERVFDDLTITGRKMYEWITPSKMNEHYIWFTVSFSVLVIGVFSYMAADYRNYKGYPSGPHVGAALRQQFDFGFLDEWKGFYAFAVKRGDSVRWFSSIVEHDGLQHIAANLCLFIVVAADLEHKYGTTRIIIISFLSGIGGNLMCAAAENGCNIVVGASGLIFGLVAFWIADLLVNFHFTQQLIVKTGAAGMFFIFFIVTAFSQTHISNWSHLGGFVAGLFPSLLCLPRLGKQRLEAALTYIGVIGTILYFVILPSIVLTRIIPNTTCTGTFL